MLRFGAHMSVAGGVSKAIDRAVVHGCEALQIFTKSGHRWRGRPIGRDEIRRFRAGVERAGLAPVVSHASYLINLAASEPMLRRRSIAALADEIDRAHALGLLGVVIHPGACTTGREEDGLRRVAEAIRTAWRARPRIPTRVIVEHTAGQGRSLGCRFEHLAAIIEQLGGSVRLGVCLDTCHVYASGYDIASETGYQETFAAFGRLVGFDRLLLFHANDSKRPCGSRVDRHEDIGRGHLGEATFGRLIHDRRFAGLAMLIETEKTRRTSRPDAITVDPLDIRNLETLRRLRAADYSRH
jgi:deoxyribonuclease-4